MVRNGPPCQQKEKAHRDTRRERRRKDLARRKRNLFSGEDGYAVCPLAQVQQCHKTGDIKDGTFGKIRCNERHAKKARIGESAGKGADIIPAGYEPCDDSGHEEDQRCQQRTGNEAGQRIGRVLHLETADDDARKGQIDQDVPQVLAPVPGDLAGPGHPVARRDQKEHDDDLMQQFPCQYEPHKNPPVCRIFLYPTLPFSPLSIYILQFAAVL